jgi:hypothetical protein
LKERSSRALCVANELFEENKSKETQMLLFFAMVRMSTVRIYCTELSSPWSRQWSIIQWNNGVRELEVLVEEFERRVGIES